MKLIINSLLFLCVLFGKGSLASELNIKWQLVTDENGIQVYTLDSTHSKIVKAKARVNINVPLIKIKSILDDVSHRHEWIPFLNMSKTLTQYENDKRIEYSHFHAPWPASDRDFVYEIELLKKTDNMVIYTMQSIDSNLMPVNNDKIRADLFETIYTLTTKPDGSTDVELIYHADPKGWIPNWIINIIQRVLPYKIMHNLRDRSQKN